MDEAVLAVRREVIGMPDKKRIALVTGASSGLGREFARLLAHEAVDELWLVARRGERLRELSAELAVPCRIFALDLTQEAALEELSEALSAEPPVVRYLVNAAGFGRIGMAEDIGAATTGCMIALNCRAAAELTERALPYMERGSRVLEIASCAAFQPIPYLAAYAATKAFLLRYSRALAAEVAARGITVTAICHTGSATRSSSTRRSRRTRRGCSAASRSRRTRRPSRGARSGPPSTALPSSRPTSSRLCTASSHPSCRTAS